MAGESRQIFISYARVDAERVDALVEGLRQLRYDAWLDEELTGGQAWWDTVLSQIRASSAVLVALSTAALESVAVRREYEYAHAVGRSLLPVVIDAVRLETLPLSWHHSRWLIIANQTRRVPSPWLRRWRPLPTPQALPQPLPEPPPIPVSYLSGLKEDAQAATLSMDEQLALVAKLKVALGRANEREAAEEILRSLQNRNDLYQVSAQEIESLLSPVDRQVPKPQRQEAPKAPLRDSSARKWTVNQIIGTPQSLVLELLKHDRHTLEYRFTYWSDPIILDGKKVAGFMASGTKVFEFEDGSEKVIGKVTAKIGTRLDSFELSLDNELVYHFP
jgi:hypothetical protein